jgi:3-dehydrosphinganine reductase
MEPAGKSALVTGGSSGIGKATAKLLARDGADVTIVARNQERLDQALAEIEDERVNPDQRLEACAADVTTPDEIAAAVEDIARGSGGPDILINSAGIARPGYFHVLTPSEFKRHMDTNYLGTLYATRAAVPGMMRRNSGHIVNISSVAGVIGVFGYTAYSASKFAVLGLSDALRVEMKPHGIGVSVVIPNDTDTPQLQEERALQPLETKITEGIVKPERLQRPSEYLAYWLVRLMNDAGNPLDAEQVARAILRGIRKEKYLIIPDPAFGIAYHLRGLVAPLAHWAFDQLVPVARRQTQAD